MVTANVPAPFQGQGERAFTLIVVEDREPAEHRVRRPSLVTNLSVTLRPKRARPSRRVRFIGRGFTKDAPVCGHYVFGGKVRKTVRFARRPTLPCGVFRAKRQQIPVKRPATGDWLLQVDQQRRYAALPASNAQRVIITVDGDVQGAVSAASAALKRSSPSAASTSIRSPAANSPLSRPSASGSTSRLEITRLSGRAPYVGS